MCNLRKYAGALGMATVALLVSPAAQAGPANDGYDHPQAVGRVPAKVVGTTEGATRGKDEPAPWCSAVRGVVWYAVKAPRQSAMVARVEAGERLDAAVAVYSIARSQRGRLTCTETDEHGRAAVSWYAHADRSYLIAVARRVGSPGGSFRLQVVAAERLPRPPGAVLPARGVRGTVDPILDAIDAWALPMRRGMTYRINLTAPSELVQLEIYRPHTYSFASEDPVPVDMHDGYLAFTPGVDGGGVYSVVVRADGDVPVTLPYRLQARRAGPDDIGPGIKIANGQTVAGAIAGHGIDVVDLYRFNVPRSNSLATIRLQQKPNVALDLMLLSETGRRIAFAVDGSGPQVLRERLRLGHYFIVVRSQNHSSGRYGLRLVVRDITTTSIAVGGSEFLEVPPGVSVPIAVRVTSVNVGGPVVVQIDRLDPLTGWQFSSVVTRRIGSSGFLTLAWTPRSVGYWRMRARFLGSPFSGFSESYFVRVHVAEPLV